MKSARRIIIKVLLYLFGSFLLIGGVFVIIASVVGGFSAHTLLKRAELMIPGIFASLLGLYALYIASDKNIGKLLSQMVDALLGGI